MAARRGGAACRAGCRRRCNGRRREAKAAAAAAPASRASALALAAETLTASHVPVAAFHTTRSLRRRSRASRASVPADAASHARARHEGADDDSSHRADARAAAATASPRARAAAATRRRRVRASRPCVVGKREAADERRTRAAPGTRTRKSLNEKPSSRAATRRGLDELRWDERQRSSNACRSRACTPTRVPSSATAKTAPNLHERVSVLLYTLPISVRYRTGRAGI